MSKIVAFFLGLVFALPPVLADTLTNPGGQGPTGSTSLQASIPATSTQVTLTAPSVYIRITNASSSTIMYFSEVSPASTTASGMILPLTSYEYSGVPLTSFWVIGSAASGNFGILAH